MHLNQHLRPAFTLIELLIVISIIGVLVALMAPSISAAREQAQRASCASNLRQFMISLSSYDTVYRYYPTTHYGKGNAFYDESVKPAYVTLKREFGMAEKILNCPSLKATPIMTRSNGFNYLNDTGTALYLGYMLFAGNGSRNEISVPSSSGVNGWTASTWPSYKEGFIPVCGETSGGGYKTTLPNGPTADISQKQILPSSRQFIATDYAFVKATVPDIRWPKQSSHVAQDGFTGVGRNQLYQDGHVVWMNLEIGRSWWISVAAANYLWTNEDVKPALNTYVVN